MLTLEAVGIIGRESQASKACRAKAAKYKVLVGLKSSCGFYSEFSGIFWDKTMTQECK